MLRSRQALLAVLLGAAIIPYFLNLGVSSIWDANEAFYAQTPREMIEAGDYVTPSFNFQLRMNKPVLSYWNVAASYHLFGISEWSERLPIAIGALRHCRVGVRSRPAPRRHDRRSFCRPRAGVVAEDHAARTPHHHRRSHHDVDGARAAPVRARRNATAAAPGVPVPDVRCGRVRRSHEGPCRRLSAGPGVFNLSRVAKAAG